MFDFFKFLICISTSFPFSILNSFLTEKRKVITMKKNNDNNLNVFRKEEFRSSIQFSSFSRR